MIRIFAVNKYVLYSSDEGKKRITSNAPPHCTTTTVSERNFLPALICQDEKVYIEKSYGKDWIP
jgi:hypothetical protein